MKNIRPDLGALKPTHVYHITFLHSEILIKILPYKLDGQILPYNKDGLVWFNLLASSNTEGTRRFSLGYTSARNFCGDPCVIQEPDVEDYPLYIGWYFVSQDLTDMIRRMADAHQ